MVPKRSYYEEIFAAELKHNGISFVREIRFHPIRKWRFDFAFPRMEPDIVLDVQGGLGTKTGYHSSEKGYANDAAKSFEAQMLGLMVLHVTNDMIKNGTALKMVQRALREIEWRKKDCSTYLKKASIGICSGRPTSYG
jgi:hypothetical protein